MGVSRYDTFWVHRRKFTYAATVVAGEGVYSAAYAMVTLGVAGGPLAMGLLYQSFSYTTSFAVAGVCSIVAFFVFYGAGPVVDADLENERR